MIRALRRNQSTYPDPVQSITKIWIHGLILDGISEAPLCWEPRLDDLLKAICLNQEQWQIGFLSYATHSELPSTISTIGNTITLTLMYPNAFKKSNFLIYFICAHSELNNHLIQKPGRNLETLTRANEISSISRDMSVHGWSYHAPLIMVH